MSSRRRKNERGTPQRFTLFYPRPELGLASTYRRTEYICTALSLLGCGETFTGVSSVTREQFVTVAAQVSQRAAALLGGQVFVLDPAERVLAASELGSGQVPITASCPSVPLRLGAWEGRVVVGAEGGTSHPPHLVHGVLELLINQIVLEGLPGRSELKNTFVHDLLRGHIADEDDVYRQARILGMDLAPPRAVLLIGAEAYLGAGDTARAEDVISSVVQFFHLPSDTICAYIGAGEVAVLKASDAKNLEPWADMRDHGATRADWADLGALKRAAAALVERLESDTGTPIDIGVGRYHRRLAGLAHSYADAKAALSLGRRLDDGGRSGVHCLDSVGIAAFIGVADETTKADLATFLLSPLDDEPELLRTLACLFEHDCQPTAAARALGVHRNTLGYRLEKIASLTGMDPRRFDNAVQIRLALVMRQLHKEAVGASSVRTRSTPRMLSVAC